MPDEHTYGFSKDDATSLVQGISNGDNWYPEIKPRGGSGGALRWGKVTASAGCGTYTVELGKLLASSDTSGESDCEACGTVSGAGGASCAQGIDYPAARVVGLGVSVTAYDPQSLLIPLKVGTDCIVAKIRGGAVEPLWGVVRGFQEHIVEYKERWDCCAPDGPPKLVGRTPVIFVGKECDEILCEECPE